MNPSPIQPYSRFSDVSYSALQQLCRDHNVRVSIFHRFMAERFGLELGSIHSAPKSTREIRTSTVNVMTEASYPDYVQYPCVARRPVYQYVRDKNGLLLRKLKVDTREFYMSCHDGLRRIYSRLGKVRVGTGEPYIYTAGATPWTTGYGRWISVEWDFPPDYQTPDEWLLENVIDHELAWKIEKAGIQLHWMFTGGRSIHCHVFIKEEIELDLAQKLVEKLKLLITVVPSDASNMIKPTRLPLSIHCATGKLARYAGCHSVDDVIDYLLNSECSGTRRQVMRLCGVAGPTEDSIGGHEVLPPSNTVPLSSNQHRINILPESIPEGKYNEVCYSKGSSFFVDCLREAKGDKSLAIEIADSIARIGVGEETGDDRVTRNHESFLVKTKRYEGTHVNPARTRLDDATKFIITEMPGKLRGDGVKRRPAHSLVQSLQVLALLFQNHSEVYMSVRQLARLRGGIGNTTANRHLKELTRMGILIEVPLRESATLSQDLKNEFCKDQTFSRTKRIAKRFRFNVAALESLGLQLSVPRVLHQDAPR